MTNLRVLNLRQNLLQELPTSLQSCVQMVFFKSVSLFFSYPGSGNFSARFESIESISSRTRGYSLMLSSTKDLSYFVSLGMASIIVLGLSNNKLSELPPEIGKFGKFSSFFFHRALLPDFLKLTHLISATRYAVGEAYCQTLRR